MCGIVGVVGLEDAKEVLLSGLEKLEYRGYDSAGIYLGDSAGEIELIKTAGKIADLRDKVPNDATGDFGIGHTRWATHGGATTANAHPHYSNDGRFYLVHNGVIENYEALKNEYLSDINFNSQTDTEVVVQLIAYFARKFNLDGLEAFRKVLQVLKGSYAFLLVDQENPEHIYLAKNRSPLLIGVGDNFNVIASDATAMVDVTKEFIELQDGDIADLTANNVTIFENQNQIVSRTTFTVDYDENDVSKGLYDFFMEKEIDEQPIVIRRIIEQYFDHDEIKISKDLLEKISATDRIYILAAGTSYHAGLVGKELIEHFAKIPVEVDLASEFGHHMPLLSEKPFFIFISQSGETADIRQVLVQLNKMNFPSLTITNVPNSTLAREASFSLELFAGPEIAVASTKAYTAQIAVQAILAQAIGKFKKLPEADLNLENDLSLVASGMENVLNEKEILHQMTKDYLATTRNAFYIGRGLDYPLSLEAALKLKEISYIQTEGFAAAELKHGTIALIEENTPVIVYITDTKTADLTRGNIQEVKARGANVFVISSKNIALDSDNFVLPNVPEYLTPMVGVIAAQLIAFYASLDRGYNVDQPRNLAKSVTVE